PLRPVRPARRQVAGDVVEDGLRRTHVVRVADAAAVLEQRVRVRCAADPGNVHRVAVARRFAVERGGLDQPRWVGLVVPAVETPRGEIGCFFDAHPGGACRGRDRLAEYACVVDDTYREVRGVAGLPAVGADGRGRGRLGAVVAQGLLAEGKVQPQHGAAFDVREPDSRLADGALLLREEPAAARD